ncbi:MAG: hypothetical protein H7Z37_08030 [Pyrinomonadaceae bacterium]|nr:hypothetical protein [Pyrinomonadaceae bacterium]
MNNNKTLVTKNHLLRNHLSRCLQYDEFAGLSPDLEMVVLRRGEVIYSFGSRIDFAYFPEDAIVSVVTLFKDSSNLETRIIGREGIVGSAICHKINESPRKVTVQKKVEAGKSRRRDFNAPSKAAKCCNR